MIIHIQLVKIYVNCEFIFKNLIVSYCIKSYDKNGWICTGVLEARIRRRKGLSI